MANVTNITDGLRDAVEYLSNIDSRTSDKDYAYTYSPNNIKTLVITPKKSYIIPHIIKANGQVVNIKPSVYSPKDIFETFMTDAEKVNTGKKKRPTPLACLGGTGSNWGNRKTQNIEGIIVFTGIENVNNPEILQFYQSKFASYVLNHNNDNLKIEEIFERLRYIVVVNEVEDKVKSYSKEFFLETTLDSAESLKQYCGEHKIRCNFLFTRGVDETIEKVGSFKSKYAIDEVIENKLKSKIPTVTTDKREIRKEQKNSEYEKVVEENGKYINTVLKFIGVTSQFQTLAPKLYNIKGTPITPYFKECIDVENPTSEELEYNIKTIQSFKTEAYCHILQSFIDSIESLAQEEIGKLSAKLIVKHCTRTMMLPPQLDGERNKLAEMLSIDASAMFEGKQFNSSFCNLLAYYVEIFTDTNGMYATKKCWSEQLDKEVKTV